MASLWTHDFLSRVTSQNELHIAYNVINTLLEARFFFTYLTDCQLLGSIVKQHLLSNHAIQGIRLHENEILFYNLYCYQV